MSLFRNLLIDKKRRRFYCEVEFITFGEGQYIIYNGERFPSQPSTIYKYETLIPVLDWSGVPCMYDRVTEQLFYNQGTGSFVAGRQIHPVEYLESTGTQYIDTGIVPTSSMNAKIDFYIPSSSPNTEQYILGAMAGSGATNGGRYQFLGVLKTSNKWRTAYGQLDGAIDNWGTAVYEEKVHFDVTLQNGTSTVYINNNTTPDWTRIYEEDVVTPSSIYLFALNNGGSRALSASCRVYSCSISHNNVLLRDFIPAIDETGKAYMFDRVTHTIFDNAGTGAFGYNPVELKYLESTGVEYIDTGIKFDCANTKIEVKTYEDSLTRIHSICGDDGNCFYYFRGTGNWAVGYNYTAFNINSYMVVGDNTFVIDKNNVYLNGVLATTYTASSAVSSYNALLFNRKTSRPDSGAVTMYYCKIWNNNTLVRDFIPVYYNGQGGMWDKVNSVFYPNVGTGTFTVSKIVEPEYE